MFVDSLALGGTERMAVNMSNVLLADGHNLALIVSRSEGELKGLLNQNIDYYFLNKKGTFDFKAMRLLFKIYFKLKPDILHANSSSIYWAALLKLVFPNVKLVFHDHSGLSNLLTGSNRIVLRLISVLFDYVIAVNDKLVLWCKDNLYISDKSQIRFIGNFPVLNLSRTTELIPPPDIYNIICIANLRHQKDHFTLINAISILRIQHPNLKFHLHLVGVYFQDKYYFNLIELIKKLNIESSVTIHGPVEDVSILLNKSHIGVLSSLSEGLPVSLLEYGLAAIPVVVTDVGDCSKVVTNNISGYVVEKQNPEALASSLSKVMIDWENSICLGKKLFEVISLKFGSENFKKEYYTLLNLY